MSTAQLDASGTTEWRLPSTRKAGMLCLILTESALFSIFVVAYIYYKGKSLNPPYPQEVIAEFPWGGSIALFGSSFTIWRAELALHRGSKPGFLAWWGITMFGGLYFLYFTGSEWYHLITVDHLTLSTNVFGTTFYSLVGLHASHVVVGLILLSTVFILKATGKVHPEHHEYVEMISWYWHFVDTIWLVVVFVVYIYSVHL